MRLNFEQWRLHFELLRYVALSEISLSHKKNLDIFFSPSCLLLPSRIFRFVFPCLFWNETSSRTRSEITRCRLGTNCCACLRKWNPSDHHHVLLPLFRLTLVTALSTSCVLPKHFNPSDETKPTPHTLHILPVKASNKYGGYFPSSGWME